MSERPEGDDQNTDASRNQRDPGDVVAEKKRIARRQILTGTAAAGAILGSTSRAHAIGVSVCASFLGRQIPPGLENKPSDFVGTLNQCGAQFPGG